VQEKHFRSTTLALECQNLQIWTPTFPNSQFPTMRIRSKLLINTLIIIFCLGAVGGIGFYYTHHVAQMSLSLLELDAVPILKINTLENSVSERWLHLIVHSGTSDLETMQQLEQEIAQWDKKITAQIQDINGLYALDAVLFVDDIKILQTFQKNWRKFHKVAQQILLLSQDFTKEDALRLIVQEGQVSYEKAMKNLRDLIQEHRQHMEKLRDAALDSRQDAALMIATLTFFIGLVALILINRLTQKLMEPLLLINSHLKLLAQGQPVENDIKYNGTDEIAGIVLSSSQLKESMTNTIQQANAIAAGDYNHEVDLRSEQDQLGQALSKMTYTLREVTAKNDMQTWLKTGQTQLHDQMSGDLTLVDLAHNIVSFLTLYVEGQIGICYLVEQSAEGLNQAFCLKQIASYAYTRRKNLGDELKFSEGLVEQAAKGQEKIVISIEVGLDEEMPRYFLMIPFLHENVVKGVIVLASLNVLTRHQQDFLDQIMPSIGIAVNSVESRTKMQELLQQTKIQAEALTQQKKTLQVQTEELQHQKEELQSQTEELQAQQEELRQTNEELEERTRELERQRETIVEKNRGLEKNQTEMEKAKKAIETKAQELEVASQYKSEFLANMSHELRTPLNSLLILAQLLAENKSGNLEEKQVEYARTIHSAGEDLLTLINEILDLAKVEAGKIEIHLEKLTLSDFVESLEHKFRHVAENKGLDFQISVAENLPTNFRTDAQRLKQIIHNLLSNAFKFTHEGEIKLSMLHPDNHEELSFLELEPAKTIAFSVIDTGIGIPKDQQPVVFEAFQQADGSTSRSYGGTGLGLSISRQLARLLGGDIKLASEENKGSTFTLYLPMGKQNPAVSNNIVSQFQNEATSFQMSKKSFAPAALLETSQKIDAKSEVIEDDRSNIQPSDKSILIIEDDHNFSNILVELAQEKGFKYLIAKDGETGLQLAQKYHPQAVILDVGLPQLDGISVMERLKDNPDTRAIPVHFISASDQSSEAKKMGAIGYLIKPVSVDEMGEAFKKIEGFVSQTLKQILVMVDDKNRQQKIYELVEGDRVRATLVNQCDVAYQRLQAESFDCIIIDVDCEHGTSLEILEKLSHEKRLNPIPVIIYAERDLTVAEEKHLQQCETHLTIKSVKSPERLLDEATLFLHQLEAKLPTDKRDMLQMVHDKETILRHKMVLVVDDDVRNTFALVTILEEKDMEVLVADNGKEALEKLEEEPNIDIVLMDIMMPEMDGYKAIQEIRTQPRFRQLPIIALTAKAMKGDKAKCIEAGANDYLAKPMDTDKLFSLMRVWLYR